MGLKIAEIKTRPAVLVSTARTRSPLLITVSPGLGCIYPNVKGSTRTRAVLEGTPKVRITS